MGDDLLKTPVIVVYDISDNRKRNALAKELLRYGIRTQKSCFEAEVDKKELKALRRIVKEYASKEGNNAVNLYILTPKAYKEAIRLGSVEYLEIDDFIL